MTTDDMLDPTGEHTRALAQAIAARRRAALARNAGLIRDSMARQALEAAVPAPDNRNEPGMMVNGGDMLDAGMLTPPAPDPIQQRREMLAGGMMEPVQDNKVIPRAVVAPGQTDVPFPPEPKNTLTELARIRNDLYNASQPQAMAERRIQRERDMLQSIANEGQARTAAFNDRMAPFQMDGLLAREAARTRSNEYRDLYNPGIKMGGVPSPGPYVDTQDDIDRKAAVMAAMNARAKATLGASGKTASQIENARLASPQDQSARQRRKELASVAREAQKKRNFENAYNRGALNGNALQFGIAKYGLPDLMQRRAEQMALVAAAGNRNNVNPFDQARADMVNEIRKKQQMESAGGMLNVPGAFNQSQAGGAGGPTIIDAGNGSRFLQWPDGRVTELPKPGGRPAAVFPPPPSAFSGLPNTTFMFPTGR